MPLPVAPNAPTVTLEESRGRCVLGLPFFDFMTPNVDRWQIARRRGIASEQSGSPSRADVVAEIPGYLRSWVDRYPIPKKATYYVRGRTSDESPNLIPNPSFERDVAAYNVNNVTPVRDPSEAAVGDYSASITASAQDLYAGIQLPTVPNGTYLFSAWIKNTALTGAGLGAGFYITGVSGATEYSFSKALRGWTRVVHALTVIGSPNLYIYFRVGHAGGNTGQAWFDGLSLVAGSDDPGYKDYSPFPGVWTEWSPAVSAPTPVNNLRSRLQSPYNVLELAVQRQGAQIPGYSSAAYPVNMQTAPPCVEQSAPARLPVSPGTPIEAVANWRSSAAAGNSDNFVFGLRWYDSNGLYISEDSKTYSLALVNGEPNMGIHSVQAFAPNAASSVALFFEIAGTNVNSRVRIEGFDVFVNHGLTDRSVDNSWDYNQTPDSAGRSPDIRTEFVDQSSFSYDGTGWGKVSSPPSTVTTSRAPYRESSTPGDEVVFLSTGQFVELLFYGTAGAGVAHVSRLTDSTLRDTTEVDPDLWVPVFDPAVGTLSTGVNRVTNPNAEVDTSGWQVSRIIDATADTTGTRLDGVNGGVFETGGTIATGASEVISGSASFRFVSTGLNRATSYPLRGHLFEAGKTYRCKMKIRRAAASPAIDVSVMLGDWGPVYDGYAVGEAIYGMADIAQVTLPSLSNTIQDIEFVWTPRADSSAVSLTIADHTEGAAATRTVIFDDVDVSEVLGYSVSSGTDFALRSLVIPPYFSPTHPTAYKVTNVSGTIRPYGLRRDSQNVIDYAPDFGNKIKALGDIRNATFGELEIAPSVAPSPPQRVISPAEISPPVWLKDSGLPSIADAQIATWVNSGVASASDFAQSTAGLRPLVKLDVLDGFRVARFDATDDGMVGVYARNAAQPFTLWVVYSYRSATSTGRRAVQGSSNWLAGPYGNQYATWNGVGFVSGAPAVTQNKFVIHCVTQDSPNKTNAYINNVLYGTLATSVAPGVFNLGASGGIGERLDGDIAEVIVADFVAGPDLRGKMQTYLAKRFPSAV